MTPLTVASIAALIAATGTYTPAQVQVWVRESAITHGLPIARWMEQINIESNRTFAADVVTPITGTEHFAFGPAQLHTKWHDPARYAHPRDNLMCGAEEMHTYLVAWSGDWAKALVSYCYGYGNLRDLLALHPTDWRGQLSADVNAYIDRVIAAGEETPMATVPSKLGPHFQAVPGWAPALWSELAARLARPLYAKIVIPPEQNLFHLNIRVIGRAYIGDGDATEQVYINQAVTDGAAKRAAGDYLDACWPQYSRAPYVYAWEGPNEPPVQTLTQRQCLNRFLYHWSILMHNRGKRTIGGSISVGRPEGKTDILDLKDAVRVCDGWSVHEYGAPTMQTGQGSLCLRYRTHILEPLASIGITPSLYITETGIDGGVIDQAHARQGWKRFCSEDQYLAQLQWYDSEIRKDPAVVAAFPFTSGNQGWPSFEVGESLSRNIAAYILETETMPAPLPQPTNDDQLLPRIRESACANIGRPVPYNPDTALAKFARANSLGGPLTPEFDMVGHRGQGYAMGVVYCPIGQWDKCEWTKW